MNTAASVTRTDHAVQMSWSTFMDPTCQGATKPNQPNAQKTKWPGQVESTM